MKHALISLLLLTSSVVQAQPPLPPDQWTPAAQLWLARAVVAEANWTAERDHTLIAWALRHRWRMTQRGDETFEERVTGKMQFLDMVRGYCAGLHAQDAATERQLWVRSLPAVGDDTEPQGWPGDVSWETHLPRWRKVQKRIRLWGAGDVRDVSKGQVRHWGSPSPELSDLHRARIKVRAGRWIRLNVGHTRNLFYGLVRI
jgi:hypothetical protein